MDRDEIAQIIATEIRRVHGGYPDNRNYLEAADTILSRLQPSGDGDSVANRLANIVREAGFWNAEIILRTDGGHDVTLFTKEGYDAIRALAGKDVKHD